MEQNHQKMPVLFLENDPVITSLSVEILLHSLLSLIILTIKQLSPQAMWLKFQPHPGTADPSTWLMSKLGRPISPLDVMLNGSQSQHAAGPEGISVASNPGRGSQIEILQIG